MNHWDAIVIGVGGIGSAAAWALAKRGVACLAIEQHSLGHALGSSHGASRLIRQAYFEHPAYVPLLKRAYTLWDDLSRQTRRDLFHRTGLVIFGKPDGPILSGVRRSAIEHDIPTTNYSAKMAARFHDGLVPPKGFEAILEPAAGFLRVEGCVTTLAEVAAGAGARIVTGECVLKIDAGPSGVTVSTNRGKYRGSRVIVTAGPWSADLLPRLADKLTVRRVPLFWFQGAAAQQMESGFPCFGFELEDGFFYGVPALDHDGVKVGLHRPQEKVERPENIDRTLRGDELATMQRFIASCLPGVGPKLMRQATCMYTMTPDEHFIVDSEGPITYFAGCSGHGYKFAPVLGEILADLALNGGTAQPIEFLRYRW